MKTGAADAVARSRCARCWTVAEPARSTGANAAAMSEPLAAASPERVARSQPDRIRGARRREARRRAAGLHGAVRGGRSSTSPRRSGARSGTTPASSASAAVARCVDADRMPGARWFPDAQAQLRARICSRALSAQDDAGDALVFWGEDKVERARLARRTVSRRVARSAGVSGAAASCSRRPASPRVYAEHAGGDSSRCSATRERRCDLVVGVARLRRAGRARSLRTDRARGAVHRRRLLVQRQAAADCPRQGAAIVERLPNAAARGRRALSAVEHPARRRSSPAFRMRRRGTISSRRSRRRRSPSSACRSTIRCTSCTRRARPACPSASCTARAARCCSTSRSTGCTATSSRATACSTSPPAAG